MNDDDPDGVIAALTAACCLFGATVIMLIAMVAKGCE